eukprot:COSAG06_NODE_961_length_11312_cov_10.559351_6_plen_335_part_00
MRVLCVQWQADPRVHHPPGQGVLVGHGVGFRVKTQKILEKKLLDLGEERELLALLKQSIPPARPIPSQADLLAELHKVIKLVPYVPTRLFTDFVQVYAKDRRGRRLLLESFVDLAQRNLDRGAWLTAELEEDKKLKSKTIKFAKKDRATLALVEQLLSPKHIEMKGTLQKLGGRGSSADKSREIEWEKQVVTLDVHSLCLRGLSRRSAGHDIPLEEIRACWGLGPYEASSAYGKPTELTFVIERSRVHKGDKKYTFLCSSEQERAEWLDKISAQRQLRLSRIPRPLMSARQLVRTWHTLGFISLSYSVLCCLSLTQTGSHGWLVDAASFVLIPV